jgi:SAM-dependent methyltransferase
VEFLDEKRDKLEKMDEFFTSRLGEYDDHMLSIEELPEAYQKFAQLIPANTQTLLDLGCGTGLELEEIFKLNPNVHVTGIDMTPAMIDRLCEKYPDKNITLFCANYLHHDFGKEKYDVAVSFETMHHLLYKEKIELYTNISKSLKPNGRYIECDYMVDTQEEEDRYFAENRRLRVEQNIPDGEFYHYDTPLTVENQIKLFLQAGFSSAEKVYRKNGTAIIVSRKCCSQGK